MDIRYPLLIDGGLSNELERQGHNLDHPLWTARLIVENPGAITKAHLAYLQAGARCITTASYQASIPGFMAMGHSREEAEGNILKTVDLAKEAVSRFVKPGQTPPLIAASIGPYGAFLADGSEYSGKYGVDKKDLREFHLPGIMLLDGSDADILACETVPSLQEAEVLADILLHTKKQAWVSFSCKDQTHISDGTELSVCAKLFTEHPGVFAIGINCTAPKHITPLIETLKGTASKKKIIVYPNSGERYNITNRSWEGKIKTKHMEEMARGWLREGADIIGGCCRVGPKQIKIIADICVDFCQSDQLR